MKLSLEYNRYCDAHARLRPEPLPVEQECVQWLSGFPSHSLEEQAQVDLADRTDSKYLLPLPALPHFLKALGSVYTVLEAAGVRVSTYENTYFDTPEWSMYLDHHNGKLNRYKCRLRRYVETDMSYLEIKQKNNRGRTIKNRMPWQADEEHYPAWASGSQPVEPSLYVNYRRLCFWNRKNNERLTVDFDLNYRRPGEEKAVRLDDVFIAELKREGNVFGSPFVRSAKAHGYTLQPISKYCLGVCLTDNGDLKTNRFKPMLRRLEKVQATGATIQ